MRAEVARDSMVDAIVTDGPQSIRSLVASARYRLNDNMRPILHREFREWPSKLLPVAGLARTDGESWSYDDISAPVDRMLARLAIRQVWAGLDQGEQRTLETHLTTDNQRQAADLAGVPQRTWNRRLLAARRHFTELWHDDVTPPALTRLRHRPQHDPGLLAEILKVG
jgi:hypothetical protein